jgi:hypothetical protein
MVVGGLAVAAVLGTTIALGVAPPAVSDPPTVSVVAEAASPTAPSAEVAVAAPAVVPPFPTVAADIAVLSVPEARALVEGGSAGPFAVKGWLYGVGPYSPCAAATGDTRRDMGPLCVRHGRLAPSAAVDGPGDRLDLTVAAGARLPALFERPGITAPPAPVVLVGRRASRLDPCHPTPEQCGGLMVVERVTWADGVAFEPGPVYDAGLEVAPTKLAFRFLDSAETLAIGWEGTILMATLVRPSTVSAVDPEAARAMARAPRPESLVWYVLGLETGYDPAMHSHGSAPPRYSWVVLDYTSGDTLARGPRR